MTLTHGLRTCGANEAMIRRFKSRHSITPTPVHRAGWGGWIRQSSQFLEVGRGFELPVGLYSGSVGCTRGAAFLLSVPIMMPLRMRSRNNVNSHRTPPGTEVPGNAKLPSVGSARLNPSEPSIENAQACPGSSDAHSSQGATCRHSVSSANAKVQVDMVQVVTCINAKRGWAGRCPEWCPWDRCGDRTTSRHVLITIDRILTEQPGQR